MKAYDLHNHTKASKDGYTPARELIDLAVNLGLKGLGICDHDVFPDESLYDYARHKGIKLALGVEITCDKAHIIGYNTDLKGDDRIFLENRFRLMKQDSVNTANKTIKVLQERGIDITSEKVAKKYDLDSLQQKLFILKYLAEELGLYSSWSDARKDLQKQGIYYSDGIETEKLDPVRAIKMIHDAGGYAIWAHPFITPPEEREKYFELFKAQKIDAVEACYAYQENGYKGSESNGFLEQKVREILFLLGLLVSGGSDSHYPLKTYSNNTPIKPGDFGISQEEYEKIKFMLR